MDRLADPVDASIAADSLVLGVDADDLEVLVGRVLVDPVGVQDTQVGAAAANTLLSGASETTLEFEVINTLADGLAVGGTLTKRSSFPKVSDNRRDSGQGPSDETYPWGRAFSCYRGGRGHGR